MKFLLEVELTSNLKLNSDDWRQVPFSQGVEVWLKNKEIIRGFDRTVITACLVYEHEEFDSAYSAGKIHLNKFITIYSFVTSQLLNFYKPIKLVDWSDGNKNREFELFLNVRGHYYPLPLFDERALDTVGAFSNLTISEELGSSISWYASAVCARSKLEKFQMLWFSIEVLVQSDPSPKIADKCPVCRSDLFCNNCDCVPTHRPYLGQKIADLLRKNSQENDGFVEQAKKLRNMVSHGEGVDRIASALSMPIEDIVDALAIIVGNVLYERVLSTEGAPKKVHILGRERFVEEELQVRARVSTNSIENKIEELEKLSIPSLVVNEVSEENASTPTATS